MERRSPPVDDSDHDQQRGQQAQQRAAEIIRAADKGGEEKVLSYINGLDASYGEKIVLYKMEYPSDDRYNMDILEYLKGRNDLSYQEKLSICKELGFTVRSDGYVTWD